MDLQPPKRVIQFLRWFCREDYLEEIEGDLTEIFVNQFEEASRKANWTFFWWVLRYFRPEFFKSVNLVPTIRTTMFRHNLLISYRGFLRNKPTFLINLIGLSTGLASAFLIFLWVQDEVRMDRFHENDAQLYTVMQNYRMPEGLHVVPWTPGPLGQAALAEIPEIKHISSYKYSLGHHDGILSFGEEYQGVRPIYADTQFLKVFSFPLLHGNLSTALHDPSSTVISEGLARKLFNRPEEAIGKTVEWNKQEGESARYQGSFLITGVFAEIPASSTMQFDVLFPYEFFFKHTWGIDRWDNHPVHTSLVLRSNTSVEAVEQKIESLIQSQDGDYNGDYFLKQYSSQYLYGAYENGELTGGRIDYVWIFSIIATLILLIASINYMNLSTARASIRMKEVGVKRTLGVTRNELIQQFMSESLLLSFLALLVAIVLVLTLLPTFNQLTNKELPLQFSPWVLLSFAGIAILTGIFASSYPSFYLSSFSPMQVLNGKLPASWGEIMIRKGLVVFQFSISIVLILSVLVLSHQMHYIHTKHLGFDRDHILSMRRMGSLNEKLPSFLTEIRALPEVKYASISNGPLIGSENFSLIRNPGKPGEDSNPMKITVFTVGHDFLETFGIQTQDGRAFSLAYGTEENKVILNETAAKEMSLSDPIGSTIEFWGKQREIVGLVKDFQFSSLYHPQQPCIFKPFEDNNQFGRYIWIKLQAGQEANAIQKISDIYETFNPGLPIQYGFVEEEYEAMYESENKVNILSRYFAGIAILLSCLGLFGLAAFSAKRRTKEIAVRKVLGASVWQIVHLLSLDFTKMILIAVLIALPIGYLFADHWLASFHDKIDLKWWFFVLSAFLALLISWLTVGFQTYRAAQSNPAESLQTE